MSQIPVWAKASHGFERHGAGPLHVQGDQAVGTCPFHVAGKKSRTFYVNMQELTWDCKVCTARGNWYTFLKRVTEENQKHLVGAALLDLSRDRDLPPEALRTWGMGWDGVQYTLPVWAPRVDGSGGWFVCDVRCKPLGQKMLATPGARIGLVGHRDVVEYTGDGWIYITEGEWDGLALRWLLTQVGQEGVVAAVPGAGMFKPEWVGAFAGKRVRLCYDADGPGEKGELRTATMLAGVADEVQFCHWPPGLPTGFDVRDWISKGAVEHRDPLGSWTGLEVLFRDVPRQQDPAVMKALGQIVPSKRRVRRAQGNGVKRGAVSTEQLVQSYRTWMHMRSTDALAVVFGTVLANQLIGGDPLWVFLVAPPGGMKSELLMSLSDSACVYTVSTLSAASLCSGMVLPGGVDPSLLPKLNEKVLVVKDFTTTLTCNPNERDEILGTLRDAYDGKFEKQFGNMPRPRSYDSRFGILAGVTPSIDAYQSVSSRLGERFLKYRLERDIDELDEEARIRRAMSNVGKQEAMRAALREVTADFLEQRVEKWKMREPALPQEIAELVLPLAVLTARLRGQVDRDAYRPELMRTRSSREFGTRLAKQLVLLASGVAIFHDQEVVDMEAYRIAAHVALGSVPDKTEEVLRAVWHVTNGGEDGCVPAEVSARCRGVSPSTVAREMQDQRLLEILTKRGDSWYVASKVKKLIERSRVFEMVDRSISLRKKRVIKRARHAASR